MGRCEINTVVIVPYIKTHQKNKTNLANIQLSGRHAWLKETFRFEDENYEDYDFRSSQKEN